VVLILLTTHDTNGPIAPLAPWSRSREPTESVLSNGAGVGAIGMTEEVRARAPLLLPLPKQCFLFERTRYRHPRISCQRPSSLSCRIIFVDLSLVLLPPLRPLRRSPAL